MPKSSLKSILKTTAVAVLLSVCSAAGPALAAEVPSAVASKLVEGSDGLSRLWAGETRLPVIVQFAAPAVAGDETFASPAEADSARTRAIHAAQNAILSDLFGGPAGVQSAAESADANLKRMDFSPMFALTVTAAELAKLAANPAVLAIQADVPEPPTLNDSLPLIGMPVAWSAGATGNGFHVAVLDTGARRTHEFLSGRVVSAACFSTTNAGQQSTSLCPGGSDSTDINSALDCDNTTIRGCGHGTHVSGIAAGFNSNLQAGEPSNGVARNGRLITINVFSRFAPSQCSSSLSNGCALSFPSDQIQGLERVFALRNTFAIASVNMSLGGGAFSNFCNTDSRKSIIDQLRAANIATVIAAGNDSLNGQVGAPGCISTAMTVASTTKGDARSGFSNWATLVDVAAPGSSIQSSTLNGNTPIYSFFNGTSMAAPHVAGAWAAIRTLRPAATVTQIENALQNTGLSITSAGVTLPRIRVSNALGSLGVNVTPPSNDNFVNAINIPSVPASTSGTNVNATVESGEPNAGVQNGGTTVWWRFTPSVAGTYVVSTEGSSFDTVATIYTGGSVGSLTQVGSDDDSGTGLTSRATFTAAAGTTYRIRIRGFSGAQGSIGLRVFGPSPANDNFANRITIANFGTVTGSNVGASFEGDEPVVRGSSVWWRFTPAANGSIRVNTFGSNFDTVLQISTGTAVSALTVVGTNDDIAASLQSELVFNGVAGTAYNISIRGFSSNQGNIVLTVGPGGTGTANIVAAVSPVARATAVNTPVTAFASVINAGTSQATGCAPGLPASTPALFSYRSRNFNNGQLGTVNGPMNIPAGARQDFLMTFTPNAVATTNIAMIFDCTNTDPAPSHAGLNTFLLTATNPPAPADIIAVAATTTGDGIMNIPLNGTGFTGIAATNIGTAANLQLRLGPAAIGASAPALPVTITVCQTNPSTAACLAPPSAPPLNFTAGANQTVTFSAFLRSNGTPIPFNPATKRLFANFFQGTTGVGSTSVAVRTQ